MSLQDQYDDAMFDFTQGELDNAIAKFERILAEDPAHFDAQLSLGMAHYRKGDYTRAIEEGHKAEKMKPHEQLVHTNLSLFYMKSGDKKTAEHHGLQARIASWRTPVVEAAQGTSDPELEMAKPPPPPPRPVKMPEMPWKKNSPLSAKPAEEKKESNGRIQDGGAN
jgi:tetratricopeptide (TPR) repeat protein